MGRRALLLFCVLLAVMSGEGLRAQETGLPQVRVKVSPEDEPTAYSSVAKLYQYADLNRRLAAACTEPQKSCLSAYASYQACKAAGGPTAECGDAPNCSAEFVLPKGIDMKGIVIVGRSDPGAFGLRPATPADSGMMGGSPGGVLGGTMPTNGSVTKVTKNIQIVNEDAPPPTPMMGVVGGTGPVVTVNAVRPKGPARISGGVIAGLRTSFVQPEYPPVARMAHMSGTVVLRAVISKVGTIESLSVMSSTSPLFNGAAIDAVKQWQYKPYVLNGEPTEVDTTITVNFTLNGPAPAAKP